MTRTRPIIAALTTALVLAACNGGSDDDAPADSTAAPAASASTTSTASATTARTTSTTATSTSADPASSAPESDAACLDGEWTISDIITSGLPITVSGVGGGMTMTFASAAGTWALRATDATIPAEFAGTTVTLSLDGDAAGQVAALGDRLQFVLDDAEGTATVAAAGLEQELDFDEVIGALSPKGDASSTCSASAAKLATSTTTIELTR